MAFNTTRSLLSLLREIDLKTIQEAAERRFSVVVTGEVQLAKRLAEALGEAPWVSVVDSLEGTAPQDVVLRVSRADELPKPEARVLDIILTEAKTKHANTLVLKNLGPETLERDLAPALLKHAPDDLQLALARRLPLLRAAYGKALIEDTSRANAMYVASTGLASVIPILNLPLSVADLVILSKNQLIMAYKLALAAGKTGAPQTVMGEIISVLGGGFLFRQIARELVGLVPVWGILPKVAIAYAGTWVIGQSVTIWTKEGRKASREELRRYYDEALAVGRKLAERFVKRRDEPEQKGPTIAKPSKLRSPKGHLDKRPPDVDAGP